MAYPDLEESNRVQRDAYARNPVSSRPAAPEPDPSVPALFRGESSATPASGGSGFGSFLSSAIDERAAARLAERNAPAPAAANPGIVVTPAATQPRVSAPTYGNEGRGNGQPNVISDAVTAAGPQDAQAVTPYDRAGDQAKLDVLNRNEQMRNAANAQAQNNSLTDHLATTDRLQAGQDLVRAESEARVAKFRAVNGADVVLRGPGTRAAAAELSRQAGAAEANVAGLKGKATAAITPAGNVLQDELAQREALSRGQLADAGSTRANAEAGASTIAGAVQKQTLEQQKKINDLGTSLINEKDPAKREIATRNLLTLMGKDKPEEYKVVHAPGATRIGPDGFTPLKDPDTLAIFNNRTGKTEMIPLGAGGGGQHGGDPTAEAKAAVAKGADKNKVNERLKAQGLPPI